MGNLAAALLGEAGAERTRSSSADDDAVEKLDLGVGDPADQVAEYVKVIWEKRGE